MSAESPSVRLAFVSYILPEVGRRCFEQPCQPGLIRNRLSIMRLYQAWAKLFACPRAVLSHGVENSKAASGPTQPLKTLRTQIAHPPCSCSSVAIRDSNCLVAGRWNIQQSHGTNGLFSHLDAANDGAIGARILTSLLTTGI